MTIYRPVSTEMTRLLSAPRVQSYLAASGGNRSQALKLYGWNIEVGSAFFAGIHYLEVGLRNIIDEALTRWAQQQQQLTNRPSAHWYLDPTLPFQTVPTTRGLVRQAMNRAGSTPAGPAVNSGQIPPGKVVAELAFGFWWSMFSDSNNRALWQPCLRHAFPNYRRKQLHTDLDRVRHLRNRIGHHEPLHHWNLYDDYQHLVGTAEKINSSLAWWIDSTSSVSELLDRKP